MIPDRDDYSVLISAGVLVRALAVEAQLAPEGVIELVRLSIDITWTDDDRRHSMIRTNPLYLA
jgi:hypothetical protein